MGVLDRLAFGTHHHLSGGGIGMVNRFNLVRNMLTQKTPEDLSVNIGTNAKENKYLIPIDGDFCRWCVDGNGMQIAEDKENANEPMQALPTFIGAAG